jgi:hypothetical protein
MQAGKITRLRPPAHSFLRARIYSIGLMDKTI